MKKSNAEKFFDILGELDDNLLTEALQADDKKSLKKKKTKGRIIIFRPAFIKIAILFLCVAIVAAAVILEKPNNVYTSVGKDNEVTSVILSERPDASSGKQESSERESSTPEYNKNTNNTSSEEYENPKVSSNTTSYTHTESEDYDPYDWEYIPDDESSAEESSSENDDYGDYYIDSIDKLNFYSVKKVIEEYDVFPLLNGNGGAIKPMASPRAPAFVKPLNNSVYYYEISRDTVFNITMETYFTIRLNNKNGFLAKKLGGTGLVEVVITENNLDDMITFKRGEKYYSCLLNSGPSYESESRRTVKFSTHKYIKGYNVVKNFEQHNFQFEVQYNNLNVVGFNAIDLGTTSNNQTYEVDDITLNTDHCVVMFIKRSFTIEQLECYFKSN